MRIRMPLSSDQLFSFEQWSAFLLGLVCAGLSLWATLHAREVFRFGHRSQFVDHALSALGWLLCGLVALLGTALLRFAFSQPEAARPARAGRGAGSAVRRG